MYKTWTTELKILLLEHLALQCQEKPPDSAKMTAKEISRNDSHTTHPFGSARCRSQLLPTTEGLQWVQHLLPSCRFLLEEEEAALLLSWLLLPHTKGFPSEPRRPMKTEAMSTVAESFEAMSTNEGRRFTVESALRSSFSKTTNVDLDLE